MAVRAAVDSADRLQAPWLALSLRSNEAKILFKQATGATPSALSERVLDDAQRLWDEAGASEVRQIAVAAASSAAEIALLVSCIEGENHKGEPWPIDPGSVRRISDRTRARASTAGLSWSTGARRRHARVLRTPSVR